MRDLSRIANVVLLFIVAIVFAGIAYFQPFWGLMDDSLNIFGIIPSVEQEGLLRFSWNYGLHDLSWGMFRPTYPLFVYPLYKIGIWLGPWATYALNALFVFCSVGYSSAVLARVTQVRKEWVWVAVAAFFYEYDLFLFPSLQEKLLLLAGGFLVRLSFGPVLVHRYLHWTLFLLTFLFGIFVKASFMIFFSMAYWAYLSAQMASLFPPRERKPWVKAAFFGFSGVLALVFFAYISSRGGYTQQFRLAKVWPNLLSRDGILLVLPVLGFFAWIVMEPREFQKQPAKLTAFFGILAFLAIFLPWDIRAYIQTIVGPAFACLCVQLAERISARVPAPVWQVPLLVMALGIAAYRIPTMFARFHDLGGALHSAPGWERQGIKEIYMPCYEGADSMRRYLTGLSGSSVKVVRLETYDALEGKAVFYDRALCPLPGRAMALPGCKTQQVLFEGFFPSGFRLVRALDCAKN